VRVLTDIEGRVQREGTRAVRQEHAQPDGDGSSANRSMHLRKPPYAALIVYVPVT
jgi:hypothetical protein